MMLVDKGSESLVQLSLLDSIKNVYTDTNPDLVSIGNKGQVSANIYIYKTKCHHYITKFVVNS